LLASVGWKQVVRVLRAPTRRTRVAVCLVLEVQAAWSVFLAFEGSLPAVLAIPMATVCVASCIVLTATGRRGRSPRSVAAQRRTRLGAAVPLLAAALILSGPAAFSLQVIDPARNGTGGDAYVGIKPLRNEAAPASLRPSLPQLWGGSATLSPKVGDLVTAARKAGGGVDGRPDFVTDSWALAAQVINATGDSVLTDGGYSGTVPVFTKAQLEQMISSGSDHLFAVKQDAPATDPVAMTVQNAHCARLGTFTTGIAVVSPKSTSVVLWDCT
jgi:hypothetical protein